jgi:hypothetical protein
MVHVDEAVVEGCTWLFEAEEFGSETDALASGAVDEDLRHSD